MRNLLRNLAASAIGLGATLFITEVALVWLIPPPLRYLYPQPYVIVDRELGWILKPNQHTFTVDHPVVTNSLGLRSPEISASKQPGALRCLVLGDSQTFGNAVAQESTYAARLEQILRERDPRPIEVSNAGVGGYDTVQEVDMMHRLVPILQPDVVIIGFYINDVGEVLRIDKERLVDSSSGEFRRTGLKQFTPYRLVYLLKRSRLVTLVYWRMRILMAQENPKQEMLLGRTPGVYEDAWKVVESALLRARREAESAGIRLIVFPVPTGEEFLADFPGEQYRSRLSAMADRLGLEYLDPTPVMKAAGGGFDDYFVTWDGHINPRTHDIIAKMLAERITAAPPRAVSRGIAGNPRHLESRETEAGTAPVGKP